MSPFIPPSSNPKNSFVFNVTPKKSDNKCKNTDYAKNKISEITFNSSFLSVFQLAVPGLVEGAVASRGLCFNSLFLVSSRLLSSRELWQLGGLHLTR